MEFIFKYLFKNEKNEYIGEKKFLNVPKDASIEQIYQWIIYDDNTKKETKLTFVNMHENERLFIEGYLKMFDDHCIFNGVKYFKVETI